MRKRSSLFRLLIIALLAWAVLLAFTYFVPPPAIWAFVILFFTLTIALISTFSLLVYIIGRNVFSLPLYQTTMRPAIRQGTLLSLVVIFNLLLRALNSWNIIMAIVIFIAAVILEILALARK